MGSWVTYGLGTENENLPGFVVLISSGAHPTGGKSALGQRLPAVGLSRACSAASKGDPVLYVSDPAGHGPRRAPPQPRRAPRPERAAELAELGHPETLTRIGQYELAFRMQMAVPEVMDITQGAAADRSTPTAPSPGEASFANNCLLARRLVEQGVRFVQLFDWGWDFHGTGAGDDIIDGLPKKCARWTSRSPRCIKDLKQRGLLDDTLIVWGGEFGRTPLPRRPRRLASSSAATTTPTASRIWLAGGGIKARHRRTARPTNSASPSPRTRSTSTTCRPRSCTCSASTHTKLHLPLPGPRPPPHRPGG